MANKPIFFDATGRRAMRVSLAGWAVAVVSTLLGAAFIASVAAVPHVANLRLPGELTAIKTTQNLEKKAAAPGLVLAAEALATQARLRRGRLAALRRARNEKRMRAHPLATAMLPKPGRPLSIAFYPDWQDAAFPALKHALPHLDCA